MEKPSSIPFGRTARLLAAEARQRGLEAPGFRYPPRDATLQRAIRRYPGGQAVVSVRVRGRPFTEVVEDMVTGILIANGVVAASREGAKLRSDLMAAAAPMEAEAA